MSRSIPRSAAGLDQADRRRRFLRQSVLSLGSLCGLNLALPDWLRSRAAAQGAHQGTFGCAKHVIMVYLHGGHPQQETFDPKPHGPSAVRGEFGEIPTTIPGIRFSELLPQMASIADRFAIIRSMTHDNPNHVTASLPAFTGHQHPPGTPQSDFPPRPSDFPPYGAVLSHLKPAQQQLPTWVRVGPLMRRMNGTVLHGQLSGFLGAKCDHFAIDQSLLDDDVRIQVISPACDLSSERLRGRQQLLATFDAQHGLMDQLAEARDLDVFYQRAFSLVSAPQTRRAFDLAAESPQTRDRYGRTEFGQRCLLARRLVEAGVPMVNVSYCHTPADSWDTHSQNFRKMKESLAPTLDAAMKGLLGDLQERGLLSETLVVINAEFGRTPAINKNAGRDHWPWVYSLALAGAGVKAGMVHGASDDSAAYPTDSPCSPADFAATLYHLMGVAPETVLYDQLHRPHPLIIGKVIEAVIT